MLATALALTLTALPTAPGAPIAAASPAATHSISAHRGPACSKTIYRRYGHRRLPVAGYCGRKLTPEQIVIVLRRAGWSWRAMPNAVATVLAETGGWTASYHLNRDAHGRIASTDHGLWQINDHHHRWVLKTNYNDPVTSSRGARALANRYGLKIWHGYSHRGAHLKTARWAINAAHRHHVK